MPLKIFIITGEPSGDLHGANLVKALHQENSGLEINCWGGNRMEAAGAKVLKHIDELAFMGFVEVAANIRTILKNFDLCEKHIREFQPDLVVFIDYPGFNLRIAKRVKKLGIKTAYYISPQIWAWKENRVKQIKAYIDHVFVILPFEKAFYNKHGVDAQFVGHPLLDEIKHIEVDEVAFRTKHQLEATKPIIALLPGSRTQEISKLLEPMAQIIKDFPAHQFVVSKVAWQPLSIYQNALPSSVKMIEGNTYELLKIAEAAIVTSGTATLETALINTPQVVVYKANWLSVMIARQLVKIKYISLVNLILDKEVVRELIQQEVNTANLKQELSYIIAGGKKRQEILDQYALLREKLGHSGASELVAKALLKIIH
jgi:lipid-A-disaccharide synthase